MIQSKTLIKISAILIALALVIILLSQVSIAEVVDTILSINPLCLVAGFILYICTYLLRAFRFSLLLNRTIGFRDLLPIICVHTMMINILPARTGELSYVYLLKKIHGRTTGEGIATLVAARALDFIVVIIFLFTAGLFIQDVPPAFQDFLWVVYFFLFFLVAILIALICCGHRFMHLLTGIMARLGWETTKPGAYVLKKAEETVESFQNIDVKAHAVPVLAVSVLIWLVMYSGFYTVLMGMGIQLPVQNIMFGAILVLLAGVLPTPGIAGFGTGQALWTVIYVPLGMTLDSAIISAFSWHIILILFTLILGSLGFLTLNKAS